LGCGAYRGQWKGFWHGILGLEGESSLEFYFLPLFVDGGGGLFGFFNGVRELKIHRIKPITALFCIGWNVL
jgi:hypothetical protein